MDDIPSDTSGNLSACPTIIALAILVKRLGGEVLISQAEFDDIAYTRLLEGVGANGELALKTHQHRSMN